MSRNTPTQRCFIDNPKGDAACVFDTGDTDDCDEAHALSAQGLCKEDCPYWRQPQGVVAERKTNARAQAVRVLVRQEAQAARQARSLSDFKTTMQVAADAAPEFVGSFGHGHYKRPAR